MPRDQRSHLAQSCHQEPKDDARAALQGGKLAAAFKLDAKPGSGSVLAHNIIEPAPCCMIDTNDLRETHAVPLDLPIVPLAGFHIVLKRLTDTGAFEYFRQGFDFEFLAFTHRKTDTSINDMLGQSQCALG